MTKTATANELIEKITKGLAQYKIAKPRDRAKIAKAAGFIAGEYLKSDQTLDVSELDLMTRALQLCCRHHSYPQPYQKMLTEIELRQRELTGATDPITILEKTKTIDVEMGSIILTQTLEIPDSFYGGAVQSYLDERKNGTFFDIGLGGDGLIKIRVRIIDGDSPAINLKEFNRLKGATDTGLVRTDLNNTIHLQGGGTKTLRIEVPHNQYHIKGFRLGAGKSAQLLIVLAPNPSKDLEIVRERPELFF